MLKVQSNKENKPRSLREAPLPLIARQLNRHPPHDTVARTAGDWPLEQSGIKEKAGGWKGLLGFTKGPGNGRTSNGNLLTWSQPQVVFCPYFPLLQFSKECSGHHPGKGELRTRRLCLEYKWILFGQSSPPSSAYPPPSNTRTHTHTLQSSHL